MAEDLAGDLSGETITIPNTGAGETLSPDFMSGVPESFREKEWVKNAGNMDTVFKMVEDQRVAIGNRPAGIPQDDASTEEWSSFNKALGVPEKPEDYEFDKIEGQETNEEFDKMFKELLHKSEVPKRKAKLLEKGFNELVSKISDQVDTDNEKLDVDFDKLAKETFGDNEAETMKIGNDLIAKYTPESLKPHLEGLSNQALVVMAGVLKGVHAEFIGEDQLPDGSGAQVGAMNEDQKQVKAIELMNSKAYTDSFHPNHAATDEQVQRLFGTWQEK